MIAVASPGGRSGRRDRPAPALDSVRQRGRAPHSRNAALTRGPGWLRAVRDFAGERARRHPFQSMPASYWPGQAQTAYAEGTVSKSPRMRITSTHLWSSPICGHSSTRLARRPGSASTGRLSRYYWTFKSGCWCGVSRPGSRAWPGPARAALSGSRHGRAVAGRRPARRAPRVAGPAWRLQRVAAVEVRLGEAQAFDGRVHSASSLHCCMLNNREAEADNPGPALAEGQVGSGGSLRRTCSRTRCLPAPLTRKSLWSCGWRPCTCSERFAGRHRG